ncbi:hypothetical protein [Streptomyces sp. CBMA29]|uniref:hypothetical protein n=1 Tax=Streptomyces sp. CBMA29 TaxID=1896314 RepID=UPI00166208AF|nr:hypothetical protein [Streptomyces sp. CBMA29]
MIAPRFLRALGTLGIVTFAVIGPVVVAHPGVDTSLKGRLVAGVAVSITIWVLWNISIGPRIVLDKGVVAVHYPLMVRNIPAGTIADVRVEHGDLVIRTSDGRKTKPPTLLASAAGAMSGHRGARSVRQQILDYVGETGAAPDEPAPKRRNFISLHLLALLIPLAVLWTEAFLVY